MQTTIKTFGNVTKDAQTRTGKNNRSYAAFTVAIDQPEAPTKFVKCFAFGSSRDFAAKLKKGDRIKLIGTSSERAANNGETITFVNAEFVQTCARKKAA